MNIHSAYKGVKPGKILFFIIPFLLLFPQSAAGQDLRLRTSPELMIPLSDRDIFSLGGGGSVVMDTDLFGFFAPYAGADVRFIAPAADEMDSSLVLMSAGAGAGVFSFPLPRLKIGASAGAGFYVGTFNAGDETIMSGNLFWRAGAEAGFRLSPGMTFSAAASYIDYRTQSDSLYQGLSLSLVADFGIKFKSSEGKAVLQSAESTPVYPILAPDYQTENFGTVTIRNSENAEIRNVEIWFYAKEYSSNPVLCARLPYLPKGATMEAPLLAAFSDQIMAVTENVSVSGEVQILYELLGESRISRAETTIGILHRNALTWDDPMVLSSFVSPNDPVVLDISKFIAGVVRSKSRPELDSNLQYALGLFEGLRLSGIVWGADPQTPYTAMKAAPSKTDYVQYPHQTIAYRSGDSDDIAVLYAAALESVGVPAALIPLEREVLGAFKIKLNESEARAMFAEPGDFLFINDEAWIPVRVSMLRDGFLRAWSEGAKMIRSEDEAGRNALGSFFRVSDAWRRYSPAGVPGITPVSRKPSESQIITAFEGVISLIVNKEVAPRAERMRSAFGQDGGSGRQRNSLGILYARYGLYREALAEFQAAYERGEPRAVMNMGNIAFLMGDFETAVSWYEKAVREMPGVVSPVISLARALYELDRFDEADIYFQKAAATNPELSERYSYLSARLPGNAARASAAMDRIGDMIWDE